MKTQLLTCKNIKEVKTKLSESLDQWYQDILPAEKKASILIKPNLNSNMNALTGNTTDLRVLAAIIEYLKDNDFQNITIGEGTNSGFHRENINVISRLRVDRLAKYYDVNVMDFNHAPSTKIEFENGGVAHVAKPCIDADFFINVPKIKMHYEVEMTVCLKSLIGCLVGRENKKKVHANLVENILVLNDYIRPDLYIVDGLIAMEGTGPSLGEPKKIDKLLIGTNPFLLDMIASKIAGFDSYEEIPALKSAKDKKIINDKIVAEFEKFCSENEVNSFNFKRPDYSWLVSIIINPRLQKYFIKFRYAPLIKKLFEWELIKIILFKLGISQDRIIYSDGDFTKPTLQKEKCIDGCTICEDFCPIEFKLPEDFEKSTMDKCISCLYCFSVCPQNAIQVNGDIGFFKQQLKQYDKQIKQLVTVEEKVLCES